jgi:hypothetical protein
MSRRSSNSKNNESAVVKTKKKLKNMQAGHKNQRLARLEKVRNLMLTF